jgi:intraflagellar transport protein 80
VLLRCEQESSGENLQEQAVANLGIRATSICWFPPQGVAGLTEVFAVSCSDGALRFVQKNGTIEKTFQAHEGSVTCVKCSMDGSSLVSTGEDGEVKLWSRTGNLRSNLASFYRPLHSFSYGSNDSIVVANGNQLCILSLQTKSNRIQWEAQPPESGDILTVDWSPQAKKILCGGEDGRFRLFDSSGNLVYTSPCHDYIISSVAWSPYGSHFLVSSHNQIELCDQSGRKYDGQALTKGSVTKVQWSLNGTKGFAWSSVTGIVWSVPIVDKALKWKSYTARLCSLQRIEVTDSSLLGNGRVENIEYER